MTKVIFAFRSFFRKHQKSFGVQRVKEDHGDSVLGYDKQVKNSCSEQIRAGRSEIWNR